MNAGEKYVSLVLRCPTAPVRVTDMQPTSAKQRAALDQFLAGVEQQAYRIARAALWEHEQALDVVQEAMLKLAHKYPHKDAGEWTPLFFRILQNCINDVRRWRMVHGARQVLFSSLRFDQDKSSAEEVVEHHALEHRSELEDPDRLLEAEQIDRHIRAAVKKLPGQQQQAFILREWQQFSIQETANIMGCTEGTVKQHHFRALRALRGLLQEVWES